MKLAAAKAWMQSRNILEPRVKIGQAFEKYQRNMPGHHMSILQRALLTKGTEV